MAREACANISLLRCPHRSALDGARLPSATAATRAVALHLPPAARNRTPPTSPLVGLITWEIARRKPRLCEQKREHPLVGCSLFWLRRWDVAPLCSLRFARLKVALSAPPTILLRKNGNLFCGGIILAFFSTTARRRVQNASPP